MLPHALVEPLARHLERVKALHERDLAEGYGGCGGSAVRPSSQVPERIAGVGMAIRLPLGARVVDTRSGRELRHHVIETVLQKAVK